MRSGWGCLVVFLIVFVRHSSQRKDVVAPYNGQEPNLPELHDDYNPGPACYGAGEPGSGMGAYCKGTPFHNCLGIWSPCGRYRWKNSMDCCYSKEKGKVVTCRMPNRLPAREKYGSNHHTYCLFILDSYDVRRSGLTSREDSGSDEIDMQIKQQERIVQLLTRISDALDTKEAIF